jgi:hypothetical protein
VGFSGTVDRRDAAVAAALAGTVVVILGYAAGLGIENPDAVVAAEPPVPPSAPATPVPGQQPPASAAPAAQPLAPLPAPVAPTPTVPASPPASPEPSTPGQPTTPAQPSTPGSPHSPHPPEPTTPQPTDPTPSCAPGVLDGVPVVEPVSDAAVSFVSAILGLVPVIDELAGDLVTCTAGTLTGASCCSSEARPDEGAESGR